MNMHLGLGRRFVRHSLVCATTFLACAALQADHNEQHGDKAGTFIHKSLAGAQMEVEMGQLAQEKGQSQEVKDLGAALVRDHTQSSQRLQQLASSKNLKTDQYRKTDESAKPTDQVKGARSDDHAKRHTMRQQAMADLKNQSGAEFDKAFVRLAIKDHKTAIAALEKCRSDLTDADLKAYIDETLPKFRHHLELAKTAARTVGVDETTIAADREDDSDTAAGAPAAGTRGSDKPSSPPPSDKERSSLDDHSQDLLNGATEADASGTINRNTPSASIEATVGDREITTDASLNNTKSDQSVSVSPEPEKKNKLFQKGDGKVLGLSTDKNDGKYWGIIPKPGAKKQQNQDIGAPATTESGVSNSDKKNDNN